MRCLPGGASEGSNTVGMLTLITFWGAYLRRGDASSTRAGQ